MCMLLHVAFCIKPFVRLVFVESNPPCLEYVCIGG